MVVNNNFIKGKEKILVQNMMINNRCEIKLKNCKLSIANSSIVDERV